MHKCPVHAEIHQITKVYNWLEFWMQYIFIYLSVLSNIVYQIVHVTFRLISTQLIINKTN